VRLDLTLSATQARLGQYVDARVRLTIAKPWAVVAPGSPNEQLVPPVVSLLNEDLEAGRMRAPASEIETPRWSPAPVTLFRNEVVLVLPLRAPRRGRPGERRVRLRVRYQACDARQCQSPESVILEAPLAILAAAR
jgi:hypothetical protein